MDCLQGIKLHQHMHMGHYVDLPWQMGTEKQAKFHSIVIGRIIFSMLGFLMLGTLIYTLLTDGSPFRREILTPWLTATLIDFYVNVVAIAVIHNRDTLVELLAKHTGNSVEEVSKVMRRPFYMDSVKAQEFGVIYKILWRGQEKIMSDVAAPEEWDHRSGIKVVDGM